MENRGNGNHPLPSLLSTYRRRFPQLVEQRLELFQSSTAATESQQKKDEEHPSYMELEEPKPTHNTPPDE